MSTRDREAIQAEERNRLGNMWTATLAFMRERNLRWLKLLTDADEKDWKTKLKLFLLHTVTYLERKLEHNYQVREMLLTNYTNFKPEVHYAKIIRDSEGREKDFQPLPIEDCPPNLLYIRGFWHSLRIHERQCMRWVNTCNTYADSLFNLTGTAIISQMEDYSKGFDLSVYDEQTADALSNASFHMNQPAGTQSSEGAGS
ncbi:MAG: hypothetical protein ACFFEV_10445 [Candidatus Thorarchaeota archaeon]